MSRQHHSFTFQYQTLGFFLIEACCSPDQRTKTSRRRSDEMEAEREKEASHSHHDGMEKKERKEEKVEGELGWND